MAKKVHSYVAEASEDIKPVLNWNFFQPKKEISKELVDHSYQETKKKMIWTSAFGIVSSGLDKKNDDVDNYI